MATKVLQSMYAALLDTLSAKSIIGYLFGANLITRDVKQLISSATTTKDGNEILLDHLYDTATKESLVQFAAIISGDKTSEKVQPLGKELQQKLCQLKESSSVATGTGQPEDSEENEKFDKSSPDTGHHPPEPSDDESHTDSEQEEASDVGSGESQDTEELDESSSDSEQLQHPSSDSSEAESSNNELDNESEQEEASDFESSDSDYTPNDHQDVEATPQNAKSELPKKAGARKIFKIPNAKKPRIADSDSDENGIDFASGVQGARTRKKILFHAQMVLKTCKQLKKKGTTRKPKTLSDAAKKELSELMDQPCAQPFIEPVDLEVYSDYRDFVPHPLCLRDMERKLSNGEYQTGFAFFDDFKQIVANSKIYNTDMSSEVMKCTKAFERYLKKREKLFWDAIASLPRQLRTHQ